MNTEETNTLIDNHIKATETRIKTIRQLLKEDVCTAPSIEDALAHRGLNKNPQSREIEEAIEEEYYRGFGVSDGGKNKYNRECKGITIDVYDVLKAFDVRNSALQHLIKKALCTGIRGHKNKEQDLQDIIDSAIRARELEQ